MIPCFRTHTTSRGRTRRNSPGTEPHSRRELCHSFVPERTPFVVCTCAASSVLVHRQACPSWLRRRLDFGRERGFCSDCDSTRAVPHHLDQRVLRRLPRPLWRLRPASASSTATRVTIGASIAGWTCSFDPSGITSADASADTAIVTAAAAAAQASTAGSNATRDATAAKPSPPTMRRRPTWRERGDHLPDHPSIHPEASNAVSLPPPVTRGTSARASVPEVLCATARVSSFADCF